MLQPVQRRTKEQTHLYIKNTEKQNKTKQKQKQTNKQKEYWNILSRLHMDAKLTRWSQ